MGTKQFFIDVGGKMTEGYLYDSFFSDASFSSPLHSHNFTEVHLTLYGECRLFLSGRELISDAGTVTLIPKGCTHRLKIITEDTCHKAFSLNLKASEVTQKRLHSGITAAFLDELKTYNTHGDFGSLKPYFSLICKDVTNSEEALCSVESREFIIHEFFANRYHEDVTLKDLSEELCLCEKQCARLVKGIFGLTFQRMLTRQRITAAQTLIKTDPSLTMSEIARLVGYRSYGGFWKVFRRG